MMQPFPDSEQTTDEIDQTLMVSMSGEHLVLSVPAQLDLEATNVLVIAAASAVAAGSTVMIDLDPDTASAELIARRPLSVATSCVTGSGGPVEVLGAAYVRLSTRDAHWTIDVAQGRLCRSDDAVDPHFVSHNAWISIQALWVTPASVTALSCDGTYLSTQAAWTTGTHDTRSASA